jgi:preprotein translocase subunit SecD
VNPDTPGYEKRRKTLAEALARGTEAALACEIPADSLTPRERERWRGGLRWYRNPSPSEALKEDWVLCELDGWAITEQALEDVRVSPMEGPDQPGVLFRVKEGFRANMAELTRREEEEVRLAIIVDGDVLSAPVLQVPLRENGAITMKDERDARALGAAIGGGTLPSRPRLVEQRSAGK